MPFRVFAACSLLTPENILEPLGLWEPIQFISVRAPRAPPPIVRWMVSAEDGSFVRIDLDQDPRRLPSYPSAPWPKERFPRPLPEDETSTRLQEASHRPEKIPLEDGLTLVLEDPNPWANDTEPVFWTD